jgi:hypothetical protein
VKLQLNNSHLEPRAVAALFFYSIRQGNYKKTRGLTCGPVVIGTLLHHLGY